MSVHAITVPLRSDKGLKFGVLTLSRSKALNSLNLDMLSTLHAQLVLWQNDQQIAFVIIHGEGERAFCAGGDVIALYNSLLHDTPDVFDPAHYAYRFFSTEYRLNALIHHYRKPLVALGQGVIMGGGVGLFMGASHKVVFTNTRYAMPEVAIGLYPDVGGSWLLGRLPKGVGEYVALTGTSLNAQDCGFLGLADCYVDQCQADELIERVSNYAYNGDLSATANLNCLLTGLHRQWQSKDSPIATHFTKLRELALSHSLTDFAVNLDRVTEKLNSDFIDQGKTALRYASPLASEITWQLLTENRTSGVSQTLERDFWVSLQCCADGDFKEGVRALLIDKDRSPRWRSAETIDADTVNAFCQPNWAGAAPLML